jgi:hypothetical protein
MTTAMARVQPWMRLAPRHRRVVPGFEGPAIVPIGDAARSATGEEKAQLHDENRHPSITRRHAMKAARHCWRDGLVGGECLRLLVGDRRLFAHHRADAPIWHPARHAKVTQLITDLTALARSASRCGLITSFVPGHDDPQGRPQNFRLVDASTRCSWRRSTEKRREPLPIVSADPKSRVFYSRVKGEVEQAPGDGLAEPRILRPSLIAGDRANRGPWSGWPSTCCASRPRPRSRSRPRTSRLRWSARRCDRRPA